MKAYSRQRKGIRRFADDALPREIRTTISEMVRSINNEITSKIVKKGQSISWESEGPTGQKSSIG